MQGSSFYTVSVSNFAIKRSWYQRLLKGPWIWQQKTVIISCSFSTFQSISREHTELCNLFYSNIKIGSNFDQRRGLIAFVSVLQQALSHIMIYQLVYNFLSSAIDWLKNWQDIRKSKLISKHPFLNAVIENLPGHRVATRTSKRVCHSHWHANGTP